MREASGFGRGGSYMAPFPECPRREVASVGGSAYVRESALTIRSLRLRLSNPGWAISYPLSSLYRPSNLHLSDSASIQEFASTDNLQPTICNQRSWIGNRQSRTGVWHSEIGNQILRLQSTIPNRQTAIKNRQPTIQYWPSPIHDW